jgi:hypothetical protein
MSPTSEAAFVELDLAIANMDSPGQQKRVRSILEGLPGVRTVTIQERGAWIAYNTKGITRDQICRALSDGGFRCTIFQDSVTGKTGTVSY